MRRDGLHAGGSQRRLHARRGCGGRRARHRTREAIIAVPLLTGGAAGAQRRDDRPFLPAIARTADGAESALERRRRRRPRLAQQGLRGAGAVQRRARRPTRCCSTSSCRCGWSSAPTPRTTLLAWLFGTNTVLAVLLQVRASRGADIGRRVAARGALVGVGASSLSCVVLSVTHETVGWVSIVLIWIGHITITGAELWQSASDWGFTSELSDHRAGWATTRACGGWATRSSRSSSPRSTPSSPCTWGAPGWAVIAAIGGHRRRRLAPGGRAAERHLRAGRCARRRIEHATVASLETGAA